MTNAVEVMIDANGAVRLLEPLKLTGPRRGMLVLLPDLSDVYAAARAAGDTPEAKAARAEAVAEFRAGNGLSTDEAVAYLESLIRAGGGR